MSFARNGRSLSASELLATIGPRHGVLVQRRFVDFLVLRLGPGLRRRNCSISDRLTSFLAPTTVVVSRPRLTSSEMDWRLTRRIRAASDCVTHAEGSIFLGIIVM